MIVGAGAGAFAFMVWPHGVIAGIIGALVAYVVTRVVMFPKPGSPAIRRIGPGVSSASLEGTGIAADELEAAIRSGRAASNSLQNLAFKITKTEVRRKVEAIAETAYRIVDDVKNDPKDLRAARQFFGYYLGAAVKVVNSYVELTGRPNLDDEAKAACARVESELGTIQAAFEKQFQMLQENNVIDLDVELSVLKKTIQMEGLGEQPGAKGNSAQ